MFRLRSVQIGERAAFSRDLQTRIEEAERLMAANSGLKLHIAANYGGRWDILSACRRLAERVRDGDLAPEDVDESCLSDELSLAGIPDPDLFIRTGGEYRVSNFLLWQLAYTEF